MEQLKFLASLAAAGVVPIIKILAPNVLTDISPVLPHDKAAGPTLVGSCTTPQKLDSLAGLVN